VPPDGETVDIDAYETGSLTTPKVFRAKFIPWDEEKVKLIDEEWTQAQREGYIVGGTVVRG
jgi:hypothetical protein